MPVIAHAEQYDIQRSGEPGELRVEVHKLHVIGILCSSKQQQFCRRCFVLDEFTAQHACVTVLMVRRHQAFVAWHDSHLVPR